MPVTYCDRAYNEVMTWTEATRIAYAPNKKSGKSFVRYGKYMKAKTVGESLRLGSKGLDLLFDFEKGLLWSTGGAKRDQPPDVGATKTESLRERRSKLNSTDVMLGKMYAKWKAWKTTFAALEENGVTRQELKALNDTQDPDAGTDSIVVAIGRRKAQTKAREILEAIKAQGDRPVTDDEVVACLDLWGFKENTNRGNVMPDGASFVFSDTVGLIKMSTCERTLLTLGSKRYPEFTQLLTRWLRERLPADLQEPFTYTSININKNYAGKLHRDGNNMGPSFIKAFGSFRGGELNYWPSDDKKTPLEDFKQKDKISVDLKDKLLLFDGNRGHYVNDFTGNRYSLVFFSIRTWNKVPEDERKAAIECGIPVPTKASMDHWKDFLGPSGSQGYRTWPIRALDGRAQASVGRGAKRPAGGGTAGIDAAGAKRRAVGSAEGKARPVATPSRSRMQR